jgi:hypothetical protein
VSEAEYFAVTFHLKVRKTEEIQDNQAAIEAGIEHLCGGEFYREVFLTETEAYLVSDEVPEALR